jgi:hypothetical protein
VSGVLGSMAEGGTDSSTLRELYPVREKEATYPLLTAGLSRVMVP